MFGVFLFVKNSRNFCYFAKQKFPEFLGKKNIYRLLFFVKIPGILYREMEKKIPGILIKFVI